MHKNDERIGFRWYLQDSGKPERRNADIASFARIGVFNHDNTASSDAGFRSGSSCRTKPQFLRRMLRALAAASLDLNQGRKCPCGMKIFNDNQRMRSMMAKGSIIARDRDTLAAPADIQRILGTFDEAKLLDIMVLRRRAAAHDTQPLWGRCGVC